MSKEKVITVMCAARLPELLVLRIDKSAESGGVSRAQFIAEACRQYLDGYKNAVVAPAVLERRSADAGINPESVTEVGGSNPSPAPVSNTHTMKAAMSYILARESGRSAALAIPGVSLGVGNAPNIPLSAAMPVVQQDERPACTYSEYDTDTGETYACGLRQHSPKIKHTRGRTIYGIQG